MLIRTRISILVNLLFFIVLSCILGYAYFTENLVLDHPFIIVIALSLVLFYFVVLAITFYSLKPLYNVIAEIENFDSKKLDKRLKSRGNDDAVKWLIVHFNKLLDQLENSVEELKMFSINVSHELKNPLSNIQSLADVAITKSRSSDYYKDVLISIGEEIQNLSYTINQLFQLSKISTDKHNIQFSKVPIDEILLEVKKEYLNRYDSHNVNIKILSLPENEDILLCLVNKDLLKIALLNLVSNACKFSDDHNATLSLKIKDDSEIIVRVSDHGPGIPKSDMPHLYDLFFRGKNVKYIGGTGIGLPLVKRIMDLHQLKLEIDSSDFGTNITISFLPTQNRP